MRVLWAIAMVCGVIVLGGLSIDIAFGLWSARIFGTAWALPIVLLLGAGACAAGVFMRPGEFKAAIRPVEPEVKRAAWLEELQEAKRRDQSGEPPKA